MRVVRLNDATYRKALSATERILRSGGIVIAPTDTVYGILGNATNPEVIKKIFKMKQRPGEKAFPVFVKDIAAVRKLAYVSDAKAKFLEKVWPGAVTVVFHHKEKLPRVLTPHQSKLGAGQAGGMGTIGIRIPDNEFILKLLSRLEFPLVQTSANISSRPPAKNIKEIKAYFAEGKVKPDLIIDGGEIRGESSTVLDFTGREPMVLKTGAILKSDLDRMLNNI